jgi:hypothetical protein
MAPPKSRSATLPPLVYVLAAFAVISGSYGALRAVGTAAMFFKPPEVYLAMVTANNEALQTYVAKPELERFCAREAEARYARRKAALPLAGMGLVLSCLMFAGAMRAMRADGWGLSAWIFAAAGSIPYQLLALGLTVVTARDLAGAIAKLPPIAQLAMGEAQRLASIAGCGIAILYYGVCVIYLRSQKVRRAFSDGAARTPPSA